MATLAQPTLGRLRSATGHGVIFLGWTLGTFVMCMAMYIVVPTVVAGWQPMVISSGSMSPLIDVGDVVLVDPSITEPGPGSVVAFDHGQGLTVHRVVESHPDGSLLTRGDANREADSSLVEPDQLIGTGRILVPFIGLVRLLPFGGAVALLALAGVAALFWRSSPAWSAAMLVVSMGVVGVSLANATFASASASPNNTIATLLVEPPTDLTASCGIITPVDASIELSWSASPTGSITGYSIMHDPPGPDGASEIAFVPTGTTDHTHNLTTTPLSVGTHTYQVWARLGGWWSASSAEDSVELIESIDGYVCLEL